MDLPGAAPDAFVGTLYAAAVQQRRASRATRYGNRGRYEGNGARSVLAFTVGPMLLTRGTPPCLLRQARE